MKKTIILSAFALSSLAIISCDDVQRSPGSVYMPDMGYSRAYETYADHSNLARKKIFYSNRPVDGTVARGQELPYHYKNDSLGYSASAAVQNPIDSLSSVDLVEAERLYLINCAICHGSKLDGNGPLYKDGTGPYLAKPATLVGDPVIEAKTEGTIYHVQTYGKGQMGSYASQLNRKQRWMIARFIKTKQAENAGGASGASQDSTATAANTQ